MALDPGSIGAPIDERYPSDLAVRSIEFLEAALPSFVARPASIETVLTEANAQAVAEVVNVANATVGAVEEDLLARFFGVPRLPGAAAVGEVTLTFDGTVSQTVPAGVRLALPEVGLEIVTTADVVVSGASSAVVQVATAVPSSLANGVGAGAVVDVLDVVPRLLSVALTLGMSGGANPESDAEFIVRASNRCARIWSGCRSRWKRNARVTSRSGMTIRASRRNCPSPKCSPPSPTTELLRRGLCRGRRWRGRGSAWR